MRRGRLRSTAWPSARPTAERSMRFTDRRVRGPSAGTCAAAGDGVAAVRPPCRLRARARSRALASHASIQQAPSGTGGSQPSSGCRHRHRHRGQPILRPSAVAASIARDPEGDRQNGGMGHARLPAFRGANCNAQARSVGIPTMSIDTVVLFRTIRVVIPRSLFDCPSIRQRAVSSEGPDMCQEKTAQPNRLAWRSAVTRDGQQHTDSTASL